jgi:hypothetical protein
MSYFGVLSLGLILGCPALACKCPALSVASGLNPGSAVFVGKVQEIYPARTAEDYVKLLVGKEAKLPLVDSQENVRRAREAMLRIWKDALNDDEAKRFTAEASSLDKLNPFPDVYGVVPRRVRLQVIERFSGTTAREIEIYTGLGGGDCGVDFIVGKKFLVFADLESRRWGTGVCSGTKETRYAAEKLRTLRARRLQNHSHHN